MSDHEKSITVDLPVSVVYNQWTQFEEFRSSWRGVERVTQLDDRRLHWVAERASRARRIWAVEVQGLLPEEALPR